MRDAWMVGKSQLNLNYDDPSGKIWSIYVAEAEKYDKALTRGWTDDMDGTLIFVRCAKPYYLNYRLGCPHRLVSFRRASPPFSLRGSKLSKQIQEMSLLQF